MYLLNYQLSLVEKHTFHALIQSHPPRNFYCLTNASRWHVKVSQLTHRIYFLCLYYIHYSQ